MENEEIIVTFAHNRHNGKNQFYYFSMGQLHQAHDGLPGATGAGRHIYDLLRGQIADGTLPAGASAPSTRGLAAELGVSRTTVTAAYEQLAAEGYLITSTGRAARVAKPPTGPAPSDLPTKRRTRSAPTLSDFGHRLQEIGMPALPHAEPARFDFLYGAVACRDFPALAWRRAYQAELLQQQHRLYYVPPELVSVFRQAKRLTDRHAPVLEQRVLASLIESGAYERHVRRMRRENERRRGALLNAVARYLPADAQVGGTAAGLHVVLWLPSRSPEDEPRLVTAARHVGVGIYPVSTLFAEPASPKQTRPAGFILGYASLTVEQIQQGIQTLGKLISTWATAT
jgi:DNA-binding transcriptional MocR family regulator